MADEYLIGDESDLPVFCLPGLTRNGRDFTALAHALARPDAEDPGRRVIVLESRGRGRSGRADPQTYTLTQELTDLVVAMDAFGVEKAHFVGTSRGGLLSMALTATAPERVGRVVLNDIGPQIDWLGLSRIAKAVGVRMAFDSYEDLAAQMREGLGPQFPGLAEDDWTRFAHQLASPSREGSNNGAVSLDYDAALADMFKDFADSGTSPDFWPAFNLMENHPVMVIRGANSDLLSAATIEAMRRRHSRLSTFIAVGEGHAPLLWDRASTEAIRDFLNAPVVERAA
ncbi:MAG: alpha/beta hydrolase [Devosia sp.]